ncbi:hypothetical protein A9168_16605 [Macellibacteroides sp. HH-ZS]|nr:hypothetical protein A9168_16605 [Macellibacteroides sp. HH-ZS]
MEHDFSIFKSDNWLKSRISVLKGCFAALNAAAKPRINAASDGVVVLTGVMSFLNIVFMFFNTI